MSDNYAASKYCRRELKFADLVDVPILPVASCDWVWPSGLRFMFQELQIARFDGAAGAQIFDRLRLSLGV